MNIATYDIKDIEDPVELSVIEIKNAYSETLYNYRAFMINSEEKYFVIPVRCHELYIEGEGSETNRYRSGFYIFEYHSDGKTGMLGIVSIQVTTRSVFIGDYIYAIGSNGDWGTNVIKIVSYPNLEAIKEFKI